MHPKLFHQLQHETNHELPQNEFVIEIVEQCWVQQQSGSHLTCGVLILSTHRLLFIEYPDVSWISSSQKTDSYRYCDPDNVSETDVAQIFVGMFFIPIADIKNINIRRFYNNKYHALEVSCRFGENICFQFNREGSNELQLLEKLKRIKIEFSWLNEEDRFAFSGLDSSHTLIHHQDVEDCISVRNSTIPSIAAQHTTAHTSYGAPLLLTVDSASGRDSFIGEDRGFSFVSVPQDLSFSAEEMRAKTVPTSDSKVLAEKSSKNEHVEALYENISSYETDIVELSNEYKRLLDSDYLSEFWRITSVNKSFSLCSTYPPILIAPADASDELLKAASFERSANRIPVLTWIHPLNGASLTRSSQPTVGINVSGTPSDEKLLMAIRQTALSFRQYKSDRDNETNDNRESDVSNETDDLDDDAIEERSSSRNNSTDAWGNTWQTVDPPKKSNLKPVIRNPVDYDDSPVVQRLRVADCGANVNQSVSTISLNNISPTRRNSSEAKLSRLVSGSLIVDNVRLTESPFENERSPKVVDDSVPKSSEATHTMLGGLMQGFGGSQSITLRDAEYRKSKYKAFVLKNKALASTSLASGTHFETPHFQTRTKLRVVDARPLISAKGNVLLGKGHEIIDRLGGAKCTSVEYAGIANIHTMRDSYSALRRACLSQPSDNNNNSASTGYLLNIHQSSWLQHISNLIFGSVCTAVNINNGDPGD